MNIGSYSLYECPELKHIIFDDLNVYPANKLIELCNYYVKYCDNLKTFNYITV